MQGKAKKIDNLLSGMSEHPHRFLVGATQLDEKTRWSTLLRRILWYFLRWIAPDREPSHPATGGVAAEFRVIQRVSYLYVAFQLPVLYVQVRSPYTIKNCWVRRTLPTVPQRKIARIV